MSYILPDQWVPVGIDDLEPAAWGALRHEASASVVAGPGSGKTEFLAQRAAYLLQTRICAFPYRILAISFKTSSASNLAERVKKRCPPEQSNRFISMTFDAFTKSLVDRFIQAIPQDWRPSSNYEIVFPKKRDFDAFLQTTRSAAPPKYKVGIAELSSSTFESKIVGLYKLPLTSAEPTDPLSYAAQAWIRENLENRSGCRLTFPVINRLAELILRERSQILTALRMTYPFVFVDEFQDTTYAQYDFLCTAFSPKETIITSVGDNKQRIMLWAGAQEDAFSQFKRQFQAKEFQLTFNFRSSPELVKIQHTIARALDPHAKRALSKVEKKVSGDVAQIWAFSSIEDQARQIANWINQETGSREMHPRDYVILVKQLPETFEEHIAPALAEFGLKIRNESKYINKLMLQDLLAEELTNIVIAILRLGANKRHPESWKIAAEAYFHISYISPDDYDAANKAERRLSIFISKLRDLMTLLPPSKDSVNSIFDTIMSFLDPNKVAASFIEYSHGELLSLTMTSFKEYLISCSMDSTSWNVCIDNFEGKDQVPLMTVHKSKGLEYDTVIFVGLDDKDWWSHSPGNLEGQSTFFVGLSRAKQRAIFTFNADISRDKVSDLYELLSKAGVEEIKF